MFLLRSGLTIDPSCYGNVKDPRYIGFCQGYEKVLRYARTLVREALADHKAKQAANVPIPDSFLKRVGERGELTEDEMVAELANLLFAGM
jgi:cytochrome P450